MGKRDARYALYFVGQGPFGMGVDRIDYTSRSLVLDALATRLGTELAWVLDRQLDQRYVYGVDAVDLFPVEPEAIMDAIAAGLSQEDLAARVSAIAEPVIDGPAPGDHAGNFAGYLKSRSYSVAKHIEAPGRVRTIHEFSYSGWTYPVGTEFQLLRYTNAGFRGIEATLVDPDGMALYNISAGYLERA